MVWIKKDGWLIIYLFGRIYITSVVGSACLVWFGMHELGEIGIMTCMDGRNRYVS